MTQYVSHIPPNNIHLSVSDLSWQVQGYVNVCVCVCCNAGLGLSHETELYQATTHSSSRPPALNALANLSSLPTLHEHERGNDRALKSTECLHTVSRKRKHVKSQVTMRNSRNDTFSEGCNIETVPHASPLPISRPNFNPSAQRLIPTCRVTSQIIWCGLISHMSLHVLFSKNEKVHTCY